VEIWHRVERATAVFAARSDHQDQHGVVVDRSTPLATQEKHMKKLVVTLGLLVLI